MGPNNQNADPNAVLGMALCNVATAYGNAGHEKKAESFYREALAIKPDLAEAHNNLANIFYGRGEWDEAHRGYQQALALNPQYPAALNNMANVLCSGCLGTVDEGIALTRQALAIDPNFPAAHWSLALMLLIKGEYKEGWREYEFRWKTPELPLRADFNKPRWDGRSLEGQRILVYAEQGFGDVVQFVRYIPRLRDLGAHVVFAVQEELVSWMSYASGANEVFDICGGTPPEHDYFCPLLSLPRVLRVDPHAQPNEGPYLKVDPVQCERWRGHMPGGRQIKIGLAWGGRPTHPNDRCRSFPLTNFAPIYEKHSAVWCCSLQKGPLSDQADKTTLVARTDKQLKNFEDTAALIANLDLVITSDTVVGHIAGALGKPVWVLLPAFPDWRWGLTGTRTPWYDSMHLYRQEKLLDWGPVMEQITPQL